MSRTIEISIAGIAVILMGGLLYAHGDYLLAPYLHLRTLLCGLLPCLTFFPLANKIIDSRFSDPKEESMTAFVYTYFLTCILASIVTFILLTLHLAYPPLFMGLAALSILLYRHWWKENLVPIGKLIYNAIFSMDTIANALCVIAFILALAAALVPPLGYDAHEYHLAVPQAYLATASWLPFTYNVYGAFPMNVEMLYMWPLSLGSAAGCTVINFNFAILTMLALIALMRGWKKESTAIVALLFLATGMSLRLIIQANIDLALAACAVMLFLAYERYRKHGQRLDLIMIGLSIGYALGSKYIAIVSLLFPFLIMLVLDTAINKTWKKSFSLLISLAIAFVLFLPWLIRNEYLYGNPVYPLLNSLFAGEPAFFENLFQRAHSPHEGLFSLPAFIKVFLQKFLFEIFPAGFSFLWILSIPLVFSKGLNSLAFRISIFSMTAYLLWYSFTQQNDRFLLTLVPLMAVLPALIVASLTNATIKKATYFFMLGVVAFQLWMASSFIITSTSVNFLFFPSLEEQYFNKHLPHYRAIHFLNELHTSPPRSPVSHVLFIGEAQTYGAQFSFTAPTVFNHHPLQTGLPNHVSHILFNRYELDRLTKGYGPLGWELGEQLAGWIAEAEESILEPVFDADPQHPGNLVVYRVKRESGQAAPSLTDP